MKLILGTVQLGLNYGINNQSGKPNQQEAFSILDLAHRSGIKTIDTAEAYGDSQAVLGKYFQENGTDFRILTKFKNEGASLKKQLDETLSVLHAKKVEGYSFHRFIDMQDSSLVKELIALRSEEKIQSIGVSIYLNEEFQAAIDSDFIDTIQIPFNLLDNWSIRGVLVAKAKSKGKKIHVRSVFLQGLFYKRPESLTPYFQSIAPQLVQLQDLAKDCGVTIGQLALRYALSFPEIDGVLIGVEKKSQLEENLKALDLVLPPELWKQITAISVKDASVLDPRNWK